MKRLTKDDVLNIAIAQIAVNGETTTLDIKKDARSQTFWALQGEVSNLVAELVKEDLLKVKNDMGNYRTYEIGNAYDISPIATNDDANDDSNTSQVQTPAVVAKISTPMHTVKHLDGTITKVKALSQNLLKPGDWEISSTSHSDVLYFLGELSRDNARSAYRTITGAKFADTRSIRIK